MNKKIVTIAVIVLAYAVAYFVSVWVFKTADSAWENRAKTAGYYNELPNNLKIRKTFN